MLSSRHTLFALLITILVMGITEVSAQTFNQPKHESKHLTSTELIRISVTDEHTIVEMSYRSDGMDGWCCISPNSYLKDRKTGKKYKFLKARNIPECPEKYMFTRPQVKKFKIYYEKIDWDNSVNEYDFIEEAGFGSPFNFYNIQLVIAV